MRLSFIFDALATGELHNLYVSEGAEQIREEKKVALLPAINLALMDLCTRFFLRKKEISLALQKDKDIYKIDDDEFIELVKVTINKEELPINRKDGYRLLSTNTIKLDKVVADNSTMDCEYKARFKVLSQADITNDTDIDLPMAYLNALLYFIASRAYTSIVNQLDGDLNESNRYAQKYVQEIAMLTNQGIDVDDFDDYCFFDERGFI